MTDQGSGRQAAHPDIERVARAILYRRVQPDFRQVEDGSWTIDHDVELAKAALACALDILSEPSEAMIEAAYGLYLSLESHEGRKDRFREAMDAKRRELGLGKKQPEKATE